jgi:hypothetical protein
MPSAKRVAKAALYSRPSPHSFYAFPVFVPRIGSHIGVNA